MIRITPQNIFPFKMRPKNIIAILFLGFPAFLYGRIIGIRNWLYDNNILNTHTLPYPLISIGNLSLGGTGKTPFVEYLIRLLKDTYSLTVVSRGYGRRSSGFVEVTPQKTADIVGDEPLQIIKKFEGEITFAVDENRLRALDILKKQFDETNQDGRFVVILDDAMQYRKIVAGLSILLIDYHNLIYDDYYFPLGRLRDNPSQKKRADIIVVTKVDENLTPVHRNTIQQKLDLLHYQTLFFTKTVYADLKPVFNPTHHRSLKDIDDQYRILLITGIAKPRPLIDELKKYTPHVEHIGFSDHHNYTYDDLYRISKRMKYLRTPKKILITTEKDVERLLAAPGRELIEEMPAYYLPIAVEFLENTEKEKFNKIIIDYVSRNKTIGRIY